MVKRKEFHRSQTCGRSTKLPTGKRYLVRFHPPTWATCKSFVGNGILDEEVRALGGKDEWNCELLFYTLLFGSDHFIAMIVWPLSVCRKQCILHLGIIVIHVNVFIPQVPTLPISAWRSYSEASDQEKLWWNYPILGCGDMGMQEASELPWLLSGGNHFYSSYSRLSLSPLCNNWLDIWTVFTLLPCLHRWSQCRFT